LWRYFVPKDSIRDRVETDRVPYDHWVDQGAIVATDGNVIDYSFIEAQLLADAARFDIEEVAFDPWSAQQLAGRMQDEGLTMVEFRQGYGSMSEPAKDFEAMSMSGRFRHGGNPVARWNAGNVAITMDPAGNVKLAKDKSAEKIDGIVAAIMAHGRAAVHLDPGDDLELLPIV
jgi:phage terminase large subunit-like protein